MRKWLVALVFAALVPFSLGTNHRQPSLVLGKLPLRADLSPSDRMTVDINQANLAQALIMYSELTGRTQLPKTSPISRQMDEFFGGYLSRWHLVKSPVRVRSGIEYHRDGLFSVAEVKAYLEELFASKGLIIVPVGKQHFRVVQPAKVAVFDSAQRKGQG